MKFILLKAEKVTFSPLSTRIDLTIDYPAEMDENDTWPWFKFSVVDDKGQVYEGLKLQTGMSRKIWSSYDSHIASNGYDTKFIYTQAKTYK